MMNRMHQPKALKVRADIVPPWPYRRLKAGGIGISFVDHGPTVGDGAGLPLILLHGAQGNWHHWRANVDALALHHRLIVPDMPGFGLSDTMPDTGLAGLSAVLSDLTQQLAPGRAALVGYSFGSLAACALAAACPDVADRLLIINPPGWQERSPEMVELQMKASIRGKDAGIRAGVEFTLREIMLRNQQYVDEACLDQSVAAVRSLRLKTKEISRTVDLFNLLADIRCPWRVVFSAEDPYHRYRLEDRIWRLAEFRGAPCVTVIKQAKHWVQQDRPDAFNGLIEQFATPSSRVDDLPAFL